MRSRGTFSTSTCIFACNSATFLAISSRSVCIAFCNRCSTADKALVALRSCSCTSNVSLDRVVASVSMVVSVVV